MGYIYDDGTTYTGTSVSFSNADGVKKIKSLVVPFFPTQSGSGTPSPTNPRTVNGSTGVTAYVSLTQEQNDATAYSESWSSVVGTVYGGSSDIVSGKLVVLYGSVDLGSLDWDKTSGAHSPSGKVFISRESVAKPRERHNPNNVLCSIFATGNEEVWFTGDYSNFMVGINATGRIIIRDDRYDNDSGAFKSAMSGIYIVYELPDQQTHQIAANTVSAKAGDTNYVWASNGENISVVVSDYIHGFDGWLIKVGTAMTLVPTSMIKAESYKVSPNQRMEESAERDVSGVLHRETVPNMPPKIEFNTPAAYDADVSALNAIFRAAYTVAEERKLPVAFYDPEEDVYKTWDCYMPNIEFPMRTIDVDAKTILYDEIRYAFIGY